MNPLPSELSLFLPCANGTQTYLEQEIQNITQKTAKSSRAGASVLGSWRDVLSLNLRSRLAQRVLVQLLHRPYSTEQDVYDQALKLPWEDWFTPKSSFKIQVTAQNCPLKSLNFAALKIKDAVCDHFCAQFGNRPNVDTKNPQVRIFAHLDSTHLTLYMDTSGEALFKRSWRESQGDAPLKETLAASMLYAIDWPNLAEQGIPLYDPCCGSGTLLIEAAQIACRIPAGGQRRFAFEQLRPFTPDLWQNVRADAQAQIRPCPAPIYGSDIAFRMVDFAKRNAERARVGQVISVRGGDALERPPPCAQAGVLLLNPPYGERIATAGKAGQLQAHRAERGQNRLRDAYSQVAKTAKGQGRESADDGGDGSLFFRKLASHWKQNFAGWNAWVLSPELKLPGQMRLQESRRTPLWNGAIECRLFCFELKAGRFQKQASKT